MNDIIDTLDTAEQRSASQVLHVDTTSAPTAPVDPEEVGAVQVGEGTVASPEAVVL